MDTRIDIVYKDGSSEPFVVSADEFTIGRSLECPVSAPDARELEQRHFRVRPDDDGCSVSATPDARTPATVSGKPFQDGHYEWGTEIEIGDLVIVLTGDDPNKKKASVGPFVIGFLVLAAGFTFYIWQQTRDPLADIKIPQEFPDIVPATAPRCDSKQATASEDARDALNTADAKSDRYAFDPQDGIQAILLYSKSAACAQKARDQGVLAQASTSGRKMVDKVNTDYATHRVALSRALETEQHKNALYHASVLIQLTQHTGSPYLQWLYKVGQKLQLKVAEEEKDKKD